MAHVAISSDLSGSIFAIDHNGDLCCNRHTRPDGNGALLHPGLGECVSSGWGNVRQLAAVRIGDATLFAGIGPNCELVTASTTGDLSSVSTPRVFDGADAPEKVRSVFAGSDGAIYMVTLEGALLCKRFDVQGGDAGARVVGRPTETIEPEGWDYGLTRFTNGDGVFFQVALNGELRYQNTQKTGGRPSKDAWVPLARAWSRYPHVMAAGNGRIYTVGSEGTLELRRYAVTPNGEVELAPRRKNDVIGSGFHPWGGLAADIEGYGWPQSLLPGETIELKVGVRLSTPPEGVPMAVSEPCNYTVQLRRLRRMKGGKEAVYDDIKPSPFDGKTLQATRYELPSDWLATGAGWTTGFTFTIPDLPASDPNYWRPGMYAVRLTDTAGRDFYVPFVVRPKMPQAPFAVIANSNTWNAYNSWGGQGKYTHTYPVPSTLPFKRPHPGLTPDVVTQTPDPKFLPYGPSVLTNTCHLLRGELWILGWLEDLGPKYSYDLYTDLDVHVGNSGIGDGSKPRYKAVLLNTHPEYWTREAYDRLKAYRDQGGSIIYLGGNGIYEEVVLSPDGAHMGIFPGVDRSLFPKQTTNEQIRLYCLMRNPGIARPEHALLGVGFQNCEQATPEGQAYVLQQTPGAPGSNPVLAGVTLKEGDSLGTTSVDVAPPSGSTPAQTYEADGWEVDQRGNGTPPNAYATDARIALGNDASLSGEMLCFRSEMGGVVFAASSINFGGSMVVDPNMQRIVQNALDQCLAR